MDLISFASNFWAELLSAVIIAMAAYLVRGSIGNFLRKAIQTQPDLDLFFYNHGKVLEVSPSTAAKDYDISLTLSVGNKSTAPFSSKEGYVYFFTPIEANISEDSGSVVGRDSQFHRHRLEIKDWLAPAGFTDLLNSKINFRITNPMGKETEIPYYIQTPFGNYPKEVVITSIRESAYIPGGYGALTVKLLE